MIDLLTRGRAAADALDTHSTSLAIPTSDMRQTIVDLCDELAAHRLARDTNAPGVAERLTRYRAAWIAGASTRGADVLDKIAMNAENAAHAMLRAEREPEPR